MGNFVEEETLLLTFLQKFSFRYFIYNRCSPEFTHTQYYLKLPNGRIILNKYLQNVKYNVKRACIFYLILVGIPSSLPLSIKYRGWKSFYLTDQFFKHGESYLFKVSYKKKSTKRLKHTRNLFTKNLQLKDVC